MCQRNPPFQEAQDKIQSCTIAQIENNKAILLLPVKKYEKLNEELQEELDTLNKYKGKIENAIGYASTLIQDQIDILNDNKESVSDYWDEQIEAVQNEKDALTESNDELQRKIDLENARYNLEKAMNNRTSRIYRRGQGFVYEADQSAIHDAQQELDNLEYDNAVNNLDKTIEALEKQKEDAITVIDEQIESWEKYAEKIDRVTNSYENFMAMQDLIQVFGSSAIADILNKDEGIISNFEFTLNSVKTDVDEIQQKIEAKMDTDPSPVGIVLMNNCLSYTDLIQDIIEMNGKFYLNRRGNDVTTGGGTSAQELSTKAASAYIGPDAF
jgi:chromosome segregation ATPase